MVGGGFGTSGGAVGGAFHAVGYARDEGAAGEPAEGEEAADGAEEEEGDGFDDKTRREVEDRVTGCGEEKSASCNTSPYLNRFMVCPHLRQ